MRTRRLEDQKYTFKEVYRWGAGIEATMSRLKHQMWLDHLRLRGMAAVTHRVLRRGMVAGVRFGGSMRSIGYRLYRRFLRFKNHLATG